MKTARGVAETRLTVKTLLKGHNSDKNQLSITSIEYDHLQLMGTITGKFYQIPSKTVGGVVETRLCPVVQWYWANFQYRDVLLV